MKQLGRPFAIMLFPACLLFGVSALAAPDKEVTVINEVTDPVPVAIQGEVVNVARQPIAESGEWQGAGLHLPPMIVHDLIFYNSNYSECRFSMNFVLGQFSSRTLKRVTLEIYESVEFHYEAGIDSENLRFGTITPVNGDPNACIIHWAAMGFDAE